MKTNDIRKAYLDFFKDKGHIIIPSAPLIPPNDPTTLFTGSGMQQLVPYLKGEPHPMGTRLVNSQPCFRAEDIEEVGDNRHTTFFEMLGNWSLGDYFKEDQLSWIWEFLTQRLNLPKQKLFITVFKGDKNVSKDKKSIKIWKTLGVSEDKIFEYSAEKNWWSRSGTPENMPSGEIGGTTSEIFFEFESVKHNPKFGKSCHPNCDCGRFSEIANSVFMEYEKQNNGSLKPLSQQNVDFGGGLERLAAATQNSPDMFQIDIFKKIIHEIESFTDKKYEGKNKKHMRAIADHIRAATFMIAEGIEPSNKQQGSVVRRLIRRSAVKLHQLGGGLTSSPSLAAITEEVLRIYDGQYFDRGKTRSIVAKVINQEMDKFANSLDKGLKKLEKFDDKQFNALNAFDLFQTHGFPYEVTEELFRQKGHSLDKKEFDKVFEGHKKLSRVASTGMFKGGLADKSEDVTKLHTATHLLHQSLRKILGSHVQQEGSNITSERLRFDFTHDQALFPEQLKKTEDLINQQIKKDLKVKKTIESKDQALKSGALAFFKETYPDKVSVYSIGDFSKELCGGPHVSSTGEIGGVKIIKQDSIGAGKRRIYIGLKNGNQKSVHQV